MSEISTYLSIITLNVNDFNSLIKDTLLIGLKTNLSCFLLERNSLQRHIQSGRERMENNIPSK
jgi:hypothetical protein